MLSRRGHPQVRLPDDAAFRGFEAECEAEEGWSRRFQKEGLSVWGQPQSPGGEYLAPHRLKGRVEMPDVPAETVYDVLHDTKYRKRWDSNAIETYEIARLSDNADVGYYSWRCPKPLKNRDLVTLRSWQVQEDSYIILNFSVKHPKYPPRKDLVRAVSPLAGYLVQRNEFGGCSLTYLAQVDPRGALPKWIVNKAAQYLAPKMMKRLHKACLEYPSWKQKHNANIKPWLYPEQNQLPTMTLSELSLQRASSLENIDESRLAETEADTSSSED